MLGLNRTRRSWQWHAAGKHPVAPDFIHLRGGTPILEVVADWMTKGYDALAGRPQSMVSRYHLWRFWLQGGQADHLICGVVKDSSDRLGRPHPLMIAGSGPLAHWQRRWPLLAVQLDPLWEEVEQTAARRFDNLRDFGDAVARLGRPAADENTVAAPPSAPIAAERLADCQNALQSDGRAFIALDDDLAVDPLAKVVAWHTQLDRCCPEVPRAVFIGGPLERAHLVIFRHALATADFIRLWRMHADTKES
ncbi:type VI secretion system-associated protein TagF [Desulfatitalea alkaliphila]|uniref:Type VI secretion system-associated protein TagF n=1 Tax=Desulfatitalea alkaliphila TaxID=2929485 RepID=A0AA41UJD8_9BACT|nr:type VI secretion system-associated protein TagF [Desulfatitalea alkaliphila]MCJ8501795.1 type VI secretion system-associated protein TagF [Desulfatitalea alkaliphila]